MRYPLIVLAALVLILVFVNRENRPIAPQTQVENVAPTKAASAESSHAQSEIGERWRSAGSSTRPQGRFAPGIASAAGRSDERGDEGGPTAIQIKALQFQGYDTPEKALQSTIWAMMSGNIEQFLGSLTQSGREAMGRELAGKTREEAAAMIMGQIEHLEALDPNRQRLDEEGNIVFILESTERQTANQTSRDEEILRFAPENGEWKYSFP